MKPIRLLHVLGQRPEMTGSGIYLRALIDASEKKGLICHYVAGVPASDPILTDDPRASNATYVLFESDPLDFPVVGMSDVMPYPSTRFSDLKGRRLTAFKAEFLRAVSRAVNRFKPDVIHTNHLFLLSALIRKGFPDLPMVTTCHGTDLRQYNLCPHLRSFVARHCRHIDRIIALTEDQKVDIERVYDIPSKRIQVIGGGYEDSVFNRGPQRSGGTVQLLYAGKLNRSKGVPWLLQSLIQIADLDWHLHLAGSGSGPEYEECIQLAKRLGTKVTRHGYVSHQRLAELMKIAHIQLLPSFFEGLPLVLFEGLASGCRVITTELTGFREIFGKTRPDTVCMIPLPPLETIDRPFQKDEAHLIDVLSDSIVSMMATVKQSPNVDDPHAERIATDYTWTRVFERTQDVYAEVQASRAAAALEG